MPLPAAVSDLIARFSQNAHTYTHADYNETQTRREFLDPLFQALGWDMTNTSGYADAYKDVIHEDSLKIGGSGGGTKAPDYCFRIGGTRKFFLEAKKPSIDIKGDPSPAYQLRRYAWSAKLPISVLSDFEEFAIYDTRIKPDVTDKASAARIFYCRYTDLPEHWDHLVSILSKDAILKGAFDKYADSNKSKRGTTPVDDAFLHEIESWRLDLAKNIALRNPHISERDLNVAVTRTIDRIVFLRICEDRGAEIYAQLQTIAKVADIYGELLKLFRRADEKYNSGLFHFTKEKDRPGEPDTLTPDLDIDDKTLRPILASLYYPDCPYEFSVLPADILGHVYEQFLGKIIRLTSGHQAKVEEKPEVRKAGGVYYTPTYIVEYIVQNTLGKLLGAPDGNPRLSPRDAAKLKILDPACGSGSFLLGAYQFLLNWHLQYYAAHDPAQFLKQKNPPIYQIAAKTGHTTPGLPGVPAHPTDPIAYRLTTSEKKRILLNNIFGVDIDQNAVETTKLSLLLKVLENESAESLANQMKLFRERALPDLANNIKCGNSLIGPDFYDNQQLSLLDEGLLFKVNAFNWKTEFRDILANGGFDIVIGNPPYVFGRDWKVLGIGEDQKHYFVTHFPTSPYQLDLFSIFMEKANALCRNGGHIGQIVPNVWLTNTHSAPTRKLIFSAGKDLILTAAPSDVFLKIVVDTILYTLQKASTKGDNVKLRRINSLGEVSEISAIAIKGYVSGELPISMNVLPAERLIAEKMEYGATPLGELCDMTRGIHPYRLGGFGTSAFGKGSQTLKDLEARPYLSRTKLREYRPFIYGKDLVRFGPLSAKEYIKYGPWLAEPRDSRFFEKERIYSRKILSDRLIVTIEKSDSVADQQVYISLPLPGSPPINSSQAF